MPAASIRNLPEPPSVREAPAREQPVRGGGGGFVRGAVAAISSMFGGPVNGGPLSEPTEVAPKGSDAEYGPGGKEIEEIIRDIDNKMPQQKTPTRQPDVPASRLAPVAEEADATTAAPGRGAHAARAARPQGGGARKEAAPRAETKLEQKQREAKERREQAAADVKVSDALRRRRATPTPACLPERMHAHAMAQERREKLEREKAAALEVKKAKAKETHAAAEADEPARKRTKPGVDEKKAPGAKAAASKPIAPKSAAAPTEATAPASVAAAASATAAVAEDDVLPGDWKAHTDPASGKTYYYSKAENQTTWTRPQPPSLIPVDRPSNSSQARASAHSQANPLLTVIRPLIAGGADRQRFRQR